MVEQNTKTQDRRDVMLEHALQVFAREGFANTDVQVIADLAGVGKGTVYRHFGNKKQLFLATAKYCVDRLGIEVEAALGGEEAIPELVRQEGTAQLLRRIATACAEFYQRCPEAVEIMIQERAEFRNEVFPTHLMYRAENRAGFDDLVRAAVTAGEFRAVDPAEATNAFADLIFGCAVNGCLEGGRGRLVERMTKAVELFLTGLVAPTSKG